MRSARRTSCSPPKGASLPRTARATDSSVSNRAPSSIDTSSMTTVCARRQRPAGSGRLAIRTSAASGACAGHGNCALGSETHTSNRGLRHKVSDQGYTHGLSSVSHGMGLVMTLDPSSALCYKRCARAPAHTSGTPCHRRLSSQVLSGVAPSPFVEIIWRPCSRI